MISREERLLKEYFSSDPTGLEEARKRISEGEPIDYIVGETFFYDEVYKVTPAVLIPRFDTERVVEKVLKYLPEGGRLLDLCCGSGCIAVSALCHSRNTEAVLVDISAEALSVARENAKLNGVEKRCTFLCADINELSLKASFDVISSNPPYVARTVVDTLPRECMKEPRIAFDGGKDGGDFYRVLLNLCPPLLEKNGRMVFEIGYDQRPLLENLCQKANFALEIYKDYGKNDRVAVIACPAVGGKL